MHITGRDRKELSIIVVDDMKFNCEFIRKSLQSEGYSDVRVAMSAREALQLLEDRHAEVLLADWVMPEMDGLELADRVRQIDEEKHRYTCILLLTARDDIASVIEAFDRGVDDYIAKPPNRQELAARIHAGGRIAQLQNDLLASMRRMHRAYANRVTIDDVTGLGNRRDGERRFDELLRLVNSRGGAVCCGHIYLDDADRLRAIHGEVVYGEIIKSLAIRLRRSVRPNDVVVRYADDSFLVGMYHQDEEHARSRNYKRVLQGINLRPVKTLRGFISVNASLSTSCANSHHSFNSAGDLIAAATAIPQVMPSQQAAYS